MDAEYRHVWETLGTSSRGLSSVTRRFAAGCRLHIHGVAPLGSLGLDKSWGRKARPTVHFASAGLTSAGGALWRLSMCRVLPRLIHETTVDRLHRQFLH